MTREQAEARARELGFGSLAGCLGMYPTWSQRELAERLGVSRGAIEHWLRHGVEMGDGVGLGAGGHGERAIRGAGQRRSRRQRQEIVIEAVRRAAARVDSPAARRSLIWAEMVEEGLAA
jgi:transposase